MDGSYKADSIVHLIGFTDLRVRISSNVDEENRATGGDWGHHIFCYDGMRYDGGGERRDCDIDEMVLVRAIFNLYPQIARGCVAFIGVSDRDWNGNDIPRIGSCGKSSNAVDVKIRSAGRWKSRIVFEAWTWRELAIGGSSNCEEQCEGEKDFFHDDGN